MSKVWRIGVVASMVYSVAAFGAPNPAAQKTARVTPQVVVHSASAGPAFLAPRIDKSEVASDRMSSMGRLAHLAATGQLDRAIRRARSQAAKGLVKQSSSIEPEGPCDATADGCEADDGEGDGPAGGQAELSIAIDSTGQHIVVGNNDTRGFALNPASVSGFAYSDDGGATFVDGGQLPVTTGTSTIGTTVYPQVFGDAEVKYLGGSNFIYISILVKKFGTSGTAQSMCLHRSTDYGHTWTGPFEIPPATNPHGLLSGANARDAADKEFADVDPDTGRVMMSWSNFTSTTFAAGGVEISTTYSDNILTATPPTWSARSILGNVAADGQASLPRFAGNGSGNVYVAWRRFFGLNQNVGFARSTDNGSTWSAAVNVAPANFFTMDEALGNDRKNTSPSMAVDNSNGPYKGSIYLVYGNNNNHDGADISFQRSTDAGVTWSSPVFINSRPGADRPQWFPWVSVDNLSGRVWVFYYDQGIAASGDLTETTYVYSDNGGSTWSKPLPLTDRPFHAAYGNDTGQPNIGDYNQAVTQNGELFAVWAGAPPTVNFGDGQPLGNMSVPDIFFKRLSEPSSNKVPLAINNVTFTDTSLNGYIDPGEDVTLTIALSNFVTNPSSAATVSSVGGTLMTTTPGVSISPANAAYGVIAPGGSANGSYGLHVSSTFVAGTPIDLLLNVTAAGALPATLLYRLTTGTPNPSTIYSENFNGVAPGTLPSGWTAVHAGGTNTVPWTTNNTFMGATSNAAFHVNANDAANPTRFERLFSPVINVPAGQYVTLDFDVAYDTEDDPNFNVLAYDGFLLRITDNPTGSFPQTVRLTRSVQIESFAEEFMTGNLQFYPKHMPRNSSSAYLQDLSAWAGTSNGWKHVHLKLTGMGGLPVQLRWEYTQDSAGICTDVRPGSTVCGVAFDNIVMNSVVSAAGTITSVAGSPNPSIFTNAATFTASVSVANGGAAVNAGSVTFKEGATVLAGPVAVDSAGHASFTTSSLTPGSHTITAVYGGSAAFAFSQGSVSQLVNRIPTTTTMTSSPNPSTYGDGVTLTATVTFSGGAVGEGSVIFKDGLAVLSGAISVDAAGHASTTLSSLAPGSHSLTVEYSGTASYGESSGGASQQVNVAPTSTAVVSSLNPSFFTDPVTFTATVTTRGNALGQGVVTFKEGAVVLAGPLTVNAGGVASFTTSTLVAGPHTISAEYSNSSGNYAASSGSVSQQVNAAPTSTAVVSSLNPSFVTQTVTFTATVTTRGAALGQGAITFKDGAAVLAGPMAVNAGGVATFSSSTLSAGTHAISAEYSNSTGNYASSSGGVSQEVKPALVTTTNVAAVSGQYSDVVTLSATVTPAVASDRPAAAGSLQFFVNGTPAGAAVALGAGGVASVPYTITQAQGPYTITATFSTANIYFTGSTGSSTLTVSREDAVVAPAATSSFKVSSPGGTASFSLSAAINEVADGSLGNIANAVPVTFTLTPVGPGSVLTQTVNAGTVAGNTLTVTASFPAVDPNVYDVSVTVGGNYYTGSGSTVVSVFDPSLGFITGGGTVMHNGVRANFGFNFKYKKGDNVQGNFVYVEHRPTGDVRVKSTALDSLSIASTSAIVLGKAVIGDVGGYTFRLVVTDNGEPGDSDQFGLQLTDRAGASVSDLSFAPLTLNGGNIQVPH